MEEKNLFIIGGCNGAGKTTASFTILPEIINCIEFVNADEIAKGLSPIQHEIVSFEAGKIMLNRINELLLQEQSFAFETTLSKRSYKNKILEARKKGYNITLLYFWLESMNLAKERVKLRVQEGGHNIPEDVIERRYYKGIFNLFEIYIPNVDSYLLFDNSEGKHNLVSSKTMGEEPLIINENKFLELKAVYEKQLKK